MNRAALFVDGSNFFHGCSQLGLRGLARLNCARLSEKLVESRSWFGTRYYVGEVPRAGDLRLAANQARFLDTLRSTDPRISVHLGRIEPRRSSSEAARALKRYLAELKTPLDPKVYRDLLGICHQFAETIVMVEKAVDVQIAVDMVTMAERDEFDTAYLLSADGDLTPAVTAVRTLGRRLYVASAASGAQLARACDRFLPLRRSWFAELFDSR